MRYLTLLERHHAMTHAEPWWDGRRDRLAAEMDEEWKRMGEADRRRALEHAERLYRERIGET